MRGTKKPSRAGRPQSGTGVPPVPSAGHAQGAVAPSFDLAALLAAFGSGLSLVALRLKAGQIAGRPVTDAEVLAQLNDLLARGMVKNENDLWRLA